MAKKDPYKKIQKRFVESRAQGQGLEYEDLTPEQRERFQNRFNTLAQTVEGRGKIAQRLLGPDAPQEQRRGLRQRIKQNLPGETLPDAGGDQTGPTNNTKQLTMRDFRRAEMQTSSYQPQAPSRRFVNTNPRKSETTTRVTATTQDRGSDRIGSGFWSIPKSPVQALKEMGQGIMSQVDYTNRAYINPVINVVGKTSEKLGGGKWKPLPELSKKEIAIESALTVGTGIGGLIAAPIKGAAARTAAQAGGAIGRSISPTIGSALAQPAERIVARQVALQQVRQQAERQALGEQIVSRYADVMSDVVPSRVTPTPSGVKRSTPASSGKFAKTTVEKAPKAEVTPKPKRVSKPKVTQTKISKADQPFLEDLSAEQRGNIYDVAPVERVTATPTPTKKVTQTKVTKTASATVQEKQAAMGRAEPSEAGKQRLKEIFEGQQTVTPTKKQTVVVKGEEVKFAAPESEPVTTPKKQWWKEETIPKNQREFLEDVSAEQRTDIYDVKPIKRTSKTQKATPVSVQKLDQPSSPVKEVKTTRKATQKKSETVAPQPQAAVQPEFPVAKTVGRAKVLKSQSEMLYESMNVPKPKEPLDFTPKKVTKLEPGQGPAPKMRGANVQKKPLGFDPAADFRASVKDFEKSVIEPEGRIRGGTAINLRAQGKVKGGYDINPTGIPTGEVGLSSEARRAKYLRERFPEAKSVRQAEKMLEAEKGTGTTWQEALLEGKFRFSGSPLGKGARRSPITSVKTREGEIVPGIQTAMGDVPIEGLAEVIAARQKDNPLEAIKAGRLQQKAATLASRARQSAKQRARGIAMEANTVKYNAQQEAVKEGEAFQRRFDELLNKPSSPTAEVKSKPRKKKK
jgi:hypothetical protein